MLASCRSESRQLGARLDPIEESLTYRLTDEGRAEKPKKAGEDEYQKGVPRHVVNKDGPEESRSPL
jgi:hypothetical protein